MLRCRCLLVFLMGVLRWFCRGWSGKISLKIILINWVLTFLQEVEAQTCVRPIIYTGGNMTKYHLKNDTTGVDDYTLWHAYYSKKALKRGIKVDRLGSWPEWRVWQWTGSGQLDGVSGDIDRNWLVGGQQGFDDILVA